VKRSIGLDFGTTNSAIAAHSDDGVTLARYPHDGGTTDTFRSVLFFHPERRGREGELVPLAGPLGIEQYLQGNDGRGRLIQSLKSYLADRLFEATSIFGRAFSLHDLLRLLLVDLRRQAEIDLGPLGSRIAVGRPVKFSQGETQEDDDRATTRLRTALAAAGWDDVTFVPEPVAAAHFYERRLDHDEVVLVGDFGGGTSDFTLTHVGPTRIKDRANGVLATDGVALAGDAIDARIVDNVVAPAVGKGTSYRSMFGKELDVPVWLFMKLRRWHHLSFLNTRQNLELLDTIVRSSTAPDRIQALRDIIDNEEGYSLYRAIERVKIALSSEEQARFHFEGASATIERDVTRDELEGWIAEETAAMEASVSRVMASANLAPGDVSRVFLTGGTSFVPAVRRIFESRFGKDRIEVGGEMISVASGLALMAGEA
jgi:hypothetical chaperone protein